MTKKLAKYKQKRDFKKISEPKGRTSKKNSKRPIFVIQKHDARRLHYDLRLEMDGVLKSWAIPKGPSLNPKVKRLAIHTEDHPMEYRKFEGVIPKGEYGAGPVIIWDRGTYQNIKEIDEKPISMQEAYKMGTLEFWLDGEKIDGGYALVRIGNEEDEDYGRNWLLIKIKDEEAHGRKNPVSTKPKSVKSGKTIAGVEKAKRSPANSGAQAFT